MADPTSAFDTIRTSMAGRSCADDGQRQELDLHGAAEVSVHRDRRLPWRWGINFGVNYVIRQGFAEPFHRSRTPGSADETAARARACCS